MHNYWNKCASDANDPQVIRSLAYMKIHTFYCMQEVLCRKHTKIVDIFTVDISTVDTDVINLDELHVHG